MKKTVLIALIAAVSLIASPSNLLAKGWHHRHRHHHHHHHHRHHHHWHRHAVYNSKTATSSTGTLPAVH